MKEGVPTRHGFLCKRSQLKTVGKHYFNQSRMCLVREFQSEWAASEKALSPQVWCLVLTGGDRRLTAEEWRWQEGEWWWSKLVK